jgi:hypothetical protein
VTGGTEHEEGIIRGFIAKDRQERYLAMLGTEKRRAKWRSELAHFNALDERFASPISPKVAHGVEQIAVLLRTKGAGNSGWVISEDVLLDGREMELEIALRSVWGRGMGTFISCIPGKLAYFENEDVSRILER